eukprot:1307916-Amphidinium_carterae.1
MQQTPRYSMFRLRRKRQRLCITRFRTPFCTSASFTTLCCIRGMCVRERQRVSSWPGNRWCNGQVRRHGSWLMVPCPQEVEPRYTLTTVTPVP